MLDSPVKKSLIDYISTCEGVRNFVGYINDAYHENHNIMLGFGLVSHRHGLSQYVPIDLYNMLCVAEKIRREVLPLTAKVHIIIADHLAYSCEHATCRENAAIEALVRKYNKKINNILRNLGVQQHYVIHQGSTIHESLEYTQIKAELQEFHPEDFVADTRKILNLDKYSATQRQYFLDQTIMMRYLRQHFQCGIKISWTKYEHAKNIKKSKSFDEPHFDRFYRDLCPGFEMSFIYTEPGYIANINNDDASCVPYSAPQIANTQRISLHSKEAIPEEVINEKLIKKLAKNVTMLMSLLPANTEYYHENGSIQDNIVFLRQYARKPEKLMQSQVEQVDEVSCLSITNENGVEL